MLRDPINQNILTWQGKLAGFQLLRTLRAGGLSSWATVCSTWVWVSQSQSRRNQWYPLGMDPKTKSVVEANEMVSMTSLFMLLGMCFRQLWLLEQPHSSIMAYHPRLQQVRGACADTDMWTWTEITTNMGAFGAPTQKKTKLWSCDNFILSLARVPTPADTHDPITGGVTGQAYPPEYGREVFAQWSARMANLDNDGHPEGQDALEGVNNDDIPERTDRQDLWEDAGLDDICRHIGVPFDRLLL